ncbi:MAG: DUF3365 domain-containing protein, partial [Planctomycetota bacterium]|nr:DUF3365 domain-containing protein [Planctomycetota bacterium]
LKAMARDPQDRYSSAKDLAQDLRRFLAGEPVAARPLGRVVRLARWVRRNPLASAVVLAVVLGSAVGWAYLARLTDGLVWSTARHSAELQAQVLEEVNEFYSELVDRLDPDDVPITHEWATTDGALPLPATFTITAGERIGGLGSGVWVRLYSDEPFPWRTDGGPRDDFERRALAALRANPERTYVEDGLYLGRPAVRLAKARRMEESCLRCHNHHPQTPRNDWELGDVRGVLEVVRTIEKDTATTGRALRGTYLLAMATTLGLVLLGAVVVSLVGRR